MSNEDGLDKQDGTAGGFQPTDAGDRYPVEPYSEFIILLIKVIGFFGALYFIIQEILYGVFL